MTDSRRIAILHDKFTELGGAEHVALEMAQAFEAPIYAAAIDHDLIPDGVKVRAAFSRWWEHRLMDSHYLLQDACQMLAWQHVDDIYEYDVVIINKNNPGWFVPRDDQTIIKYTHTTPREPYDLFPASGGHYLHRILNTVRRVLYRPNITYPDAWACNSDLVKRRTQKYWGVADTDLHVIYPPVPTQNYSPQDAETQPYYFTLSRLVGHKRIDEIITAFNQLGPDYPLKVAGSGPQRDHLEAIAADHIDFLGYIDDREKQRRLSEAKGFVFAAKNEDFGMVPIEAMAAGTPVIGVRDGFTQHQILEGKNGYTFSREGGHLREKIRYFDANPVAWSPEEIAGFSDRFSATRFRQELRALIEDAQAATAITVPWEESGRGGTGVEAVETAADGGLEE